MTETLPVRKEPYEIEVTAGKKYWWCACGRSKTQPFCDGSHKGSGFEPVAFVPDEGGPVYFCGCKQTASKPFCDGTHGRL